MDNHTVPTRHAGESIYEIGPLPLGRHRIVVDLGNSDLGSAEVEIVPTPPEFPGKRVTFRAIGAEASAFGDATGHRLIAKGARLIEVDRSGAPVFDVVVDSYFTAAGAAASTEGGLVFGSDGMGHLVLKAFNRQLALGATWQLPREVADVQALELTRRGRGFLLHSRRSDHAWLIPSGILPPPTPAIQPDPISLDDKLVPVQVIDTVASPEAPSRRWIACGGDLCLNDHRAHGSHFLGLGNALIGSIFEHGGDVWVRSFRPQAKDSELLRIDDKGGIRRFALPVSDRGSRETVCGTHLVIALEHAGTLVWDLEQGRAVRLLPDFGRFGNTSPAPPACSPDGGNAAVATPYGNSVTIVRLDDGEPLASFRVDAAGQIRWTGKGLYVQPVFLPLD